MKNVIPINFDLASDRFANRNGEKQIQHKSHHWDVFPNLLFVGVCWDPLQSVMDLNSLINAFPLNILSTVFIITEDSKCPVDGDLRGPLASLDVSLLPSSGHRG